MAASQNGWVANQRDRVAKQLVPGTNTYLTVRKDAPGLVLLEVASAFDRLVQDIDTGRGTLDDWGYAERPIRGGITLSNHASGTAIDLNALKHPLGVPGTFTANEKAALLSILRVTGDVVRWGGLYVGRKDEMHLEINDAQDLSDCQRALGAIREFNSNAGIPAPIQEPGVNDIARNLFYVPGKPVMHGDDVTELQEVLNAWYPWMSLEVDGWFGAATAEAVRELQRRAQITVDGIAGPKTRALLGL